ncbi:MAG: DUF1559 domain-containing protein [Planctomycetaceae bacterium]
MSEGASNTICVFENHHWRFSRDLPQRFARNASWISPVNVVESLCKKINTANQQNGRGDNDNRGASLSSVHVGGAHALFADGSVKFLSQNMSHGQDRHNGGTRQEGVLMALATAGGGETVGEY